MITPNTSTELDIKQKYDLIKSILKAATYATFATASTIVVTSIQGGSNIKDSLAIGLGVGLVAGIKNIFKHAFGVDIDLTRMKK